MTWPRRSSESCERERVHDGAEHADVVGLGGVHSVGGTGLAPPEVAPTDDHGDIDPELADLDDLRRQLVQDGRVDSAAAWFGKGLTGQLEHDASPLRGVGLDAVR